VPGSWSPTLLTPVILKATIDSHATAEKAISFLRIRIWGLPFLFIYQMRNALLVGINKSKYLVTGTLAEAAANILFDYVLIFGAFGFPLLGFNGAAYASIIAEFTGMFVIFLVLKSKGIDREFSLFKKATWDAPLIRSILSMSGPLVFQYAVSIVSWLLFYILIERNASQTSLAVSNTMRNFFGLFGVFAWAFAATANSMVSNVIGQGKKDEVIPLINKIAKVSAAISASFGLLLIISPRFYLSVYGLSEEFIQAGIPLLRLVALVMVLMSFSTVWLSAVTGTGNSRVTLLIEVGAIFLYSIYVWLVLEVYQLSILWGWASELLYWTCLFSCSFYYIKEQQVEGKNNLNAVAHQLKRIWGTDLS
jgi:Na+-driven multidrug efflux pump